MRDSEEWLDKQIEGSGAVKELLRLELRRVVGMLEFVIMQRVVIIDNYSPGARPEKDKIDGGEGVKVLRGQNMRRIFRGDTDL